MGELAISCDLPVQLVATRRILVSAASWLTTPRLQASHKESPRNNQHNQRTTYSTYKLKFSSIKANFIADKPKQKKQAKASIDTLQCNQ